MQSSGIRRRRENVISLERSEAVMSVQRDVQRIARAVVLAALLGCAANQPHLDPLDPVQSRLYDDIAYLSSQALAGRLTGTPGNDTAAAFIARRYHNLALIGAFNGTSCVTDTCQHSFFQFFRVSPFMAHSIDVTINDKSQNVGALVLGTDSLVRGEYVLVGAHYDHLGRSTTYSLDAGEFHVVHPGADDNGSGTAAVLELARRFAQHPARRPILFLNFSGEELGLVGSQFFVDNLPVAGDSIATMVNLDMVGRLRDDKLLLFSGAEHGRIGALVDSVEQLPPVLPFHHQWLDGSREVSDQASFARVHVPVLGLFTDYHSDYHRPSDIVQRINFPGLEKVVEFTERFVRAVADGRDRPARRD
jgi:hypothetical protein